MAKGPGTYLYAGLVARLASNGNPKAVELNKRESLHCTLMYGRIDGRKSPIFHSHTIMGYYTEVISVAYIPHADCTCLILENSKMIQRRHDYFRGLGLDLGYTFEPHITVSQGNTVCEWTDLIGMEVSLSSEYLQVIVKEPKVNELIVPKDGEDSRQVG